MLLKPVRNYEDDYFYYVIFEAVTGMKVGQFNLHIYSKQFGTQEVNDWYKDVKEAEDIIFAHSRNAYDKTPNP